MMARFMPPKGYKTVTVPVDLLKEVEALMVKLKNEGSGLYMNVTDFVKDSIRRRIEELRRMYFLGDHEG